MARLPTLRTDHLNPPGDTPGTHFFYGLTRPQGHKAAENIQSMKNPSDLIGSRIRDLPAF